MTSCPLAHPYTPANTLVLRGSPRRHCRTCRRIRALWVWYSRVEAGVCGACGARERVSATRCADCLSDHRKSMGVVRAARREEVARVA